MKRKLSLLISILLITAHLAKTYGSGQLLAGIAFTLPALATDFVALIMLLRVWGREPVAQDDSWPAFLSSILGAHLFILASLAGVPLIAAPPLSVPLRAACGMFLTLSTPLAIYTMLVLGLNFSVIPEAKHLVTTGPYARSRHPLYVLYIFWSVMFVGIGQSLAVVLLASADIPLQIYRARREERVLLATFGEEYERYRATTGWLGARRTRAAQGVEREPTQD
jgi:protein-S-isoprenylcysteine O-methyltransferase Ste14